MKLNLTAWGKEKQYHYESIKWYSKMEVFLWLVRVFLEFIFKIKCFLKTRIFLDKMKNCKINAFSKQQISGKTVGLKSWCGGSSMLRYFLIPYFFVLCQVADRDFFCLGWVPEVLLSVTCTSLSAPDSLVSTCQGKTSKVKPES